MKNIRDPKKVLSAESIAKLPIMVRMSRASSPTPDG